MKKGSATALPFNSLISEKSGRLGFDGLGPGS